MARRTSTKPSKIVDSEEEEDQLEVERAKSAKKPRLSPSPAEAGPDDAGLSDDDAEEDIPALPADAAPQRCEDGYVVGSIVRISCDNFMTYDSITAYPGPYLNMICAPNGAGKSSLVFAIAIGLGFPVSILGKASDLKAFVNKNTDRTKAWVEIELKTPTRKNIVIKRTFTSEDNSSQFYIDDKKVSQTTVAEKIAEFNVQVGNLCSFLPQEKVANFTAIEPKQLLTDTMKTAGHPLLTDWHQDLASQKKNLTRIQTALGKNKHKLVVLEEKNRNADRDIEVYRERQRIDNEIRVWEAIRPLAEYKLLKDDHNQKRMIRSGLQAEYDAIEMANAPIITQKALLKQLVTATEKDCKKQVTRQEKNDSALRLHTSTLSAAEDTANDLRERLAELASNEKKRMDDISKLEREITALEKKVAKAPPKTDTSEIQTKLLDANRRLSEVVNQADDLRGQFEAVQREVNGYKQEVADAEKRLQDLDNAVKQRESACQAHDKALWTAVCWLRQNKDKFKGRIWEPARLSVNIKDRKCANQVEALIPKTHFRTILCETYDDYDLISNELNEKLQFGNKKETLRVNVVELPADKRSLAIYPKPMSNEDLKRTLGFDGFAIDQLEGPEEMLAYLCGVTYLHTRAYCIGRQNINRDAIERETCRVRDYATPDQRVTVRFSRYGARGCQVQSSVTGTAKVLTSSMDQEQKSALELERTTAKIKLEDARVRLGNMQPEDIRLRQIVDTINAEKRSLNKEKGDAQRAELVHTQDQSKLQTKKTSLVAAKAKPSEDAKRADLRRRLRTAALNRVKAAQAVTKAVADGVSIQNDITVAVLENIQAQADLAAIEVQFRQQLVALREAEEALTNANAILQNAKEAAATVFEEAMSMQRDLPDDIIPLFDHERTQNPSLYDVMTKLEVLQASLAHHLPIPAALIAEYETRKQEIVRLQRQVASETLNVAQATKRLEKVHNKFRPALKALVDAISRFFTTFFADLGLNGEIMLNDKDPDYAMWGLEIWVSFRDNGSLQLLTSFRQSGGEKALSTIAFVMSLIQLARAPFSLVDEMNQGMDARSERAALKQLVDVTCSGRCGQYFLLTPKLLEDMYYHERMRVLVIHNGAWMSENGFPVHELIQQRLEQKRANGPRATLQAVA